MSYILKYCASKKQDHSIRKNGGQLRSILNQIGLRGLCLSITNLPSKWKQIFWPIVVRKFWNTSTYIEKTNRNDWQTSFCKTHNTAIDWLLLQIEPIDWHSLALNRYGTLLKEAPRWIATINNCDCVTFVSVFKNLFWNYFCEVLWHYYCGFEQILRQIQFHFEILK